MGFNQTDPATSFNKMGPVASLSLSVPEMENLGAKRHPVTINIPLFFTIFK